MSEHTFTPGKPESFVFRTRIHLGKLERDVPENTVVQFDGQVLTLEGRPYDYPEFRSTVKVGWVVKVEKGAKAAKARAPEPVPAPTAPASGPAADRAARFGVAQEERVVSRVPQQPSGERVSGVNLSSRSKAFQPGVVVSGDASEKAIPGSSFPTKAGKTAGVKGAPVSGATSRGTGGTEGTVVASIRPIGTRDPIVLDGSTAAAAELRRLESISSRRNVVAAKGIVSAVAVGNLNELNEALDPGARAAMARDARRIEALRALEKARIEEEAKRVAGESEEEFAEDPSAAAEETGIIPEPEPSPEGAAKLEEKLDELSIPVRPSKPLLPPAGATEEVVRTILAGDSEELSPGFSWDRKLHWKTRVKLGAALAAEPEKLALVLAVETPAVVKGIEAAIENPERPVREVDGIRFR